MQKIFMIFLLNVKHIVTEKISFTHFFKNIVIEKLIIFTLIFLKKNLMFNIVLEVID